MQNKSGKLLCLVIEFVRDRYGDDSGEVIERKKFQKNSKKKAYGKPQSDGGNT